MWEIASQKGFRKTAVYLNGCLGRSEREREREREKKLRRKWFI